MENYTKGIVLGVGTFGKVLMATHKEVSFAGGWGVLITQLKQESQMLADTYKKKTGDACMHALGAAAAGLGAGDVPEPRLCVPL